VRCIKLDATPMGKKVYVPMGFRDEYDLARYQGIASDLDVAPSNALEPLTLERLSEVIAFDAAVFGAERSQVLASLITRQPEWCFVLRGAGGVVGYIVARQGSNAVQLGPWIATEPLAAEQLLAAVFQRVNGRKVFIDVPHLNQPGQKLMARVNFTVQRGYTRMFLGENALIGQPQHIYSTSGAEKG
jgi:hypothetical protein